MGILFFVVVGIMAFIIYNLFSSRKASQNLRQRLINAFGKAPTSFDSAIWGSVTDYWDRKLKYETIDVAIDDLTWSDLDMDDVFKRMNNCLTSVGDEGCMQPFMSQDGRMNHFEKEISSLLFLRTIPKNFWKFK